MKEATIIFPNQLFYDFPALKMDRKVFLVEEKRYFCDFKFHKNKLVLHRSSMKFYQDFLKEKGFDVSYITFSEDWIKKLKQEDFDTLHIVDVVDVELAKKIKNSGFKVIWYDSPAFLTPKDKFEDFFKDKKTFSQTSFYINQRKKLKILVDSKNKPIGEKWSFDPENRKKMPEGIVTPELITYGQNKYVTEAKSYVDKNFPGNYSSCDDFIYPIMFEGVEKWLEDFLHKRLACFGDYEDAILKDQSWLFHSVLSYALNIGLITPNKIVEKTLEFSKEHEIPLNSLEGFIRQVIGWREFIKGVYALKGEEQASSNFWNHTNKIPYSMYTGETGIDPIDTVIKRLLKTGYTHHIERLMVLGNFLFLCEVSPNEVYKWFMEMYIDAYDWVMVPNVYGMSQYADGGLMVTKPYLSSSNYVKKMSNFEEGEWCRVWDGLYWRFIAKNQDFFQHNPRLRVMASYLTRIDQAKLKEHILVAEKFLQDTF